MRRTGIDLAGFLANAPSLFGEEATIDEEVDPDIAQGTHHGAIRHFDFDNGDVLSCVRWDSQFHITSTDIIRALVHRFQDIGRPVVNMKKFEEGVFSDLRSLKPGVDARLEPPRSEFLELLYKHHCVRTQKKQKVFFWSSVPHDLLFREALERDLKREAMGIEPTTKLGEKADPTSLVEIDGIELPISVPPTLAAHARAKPAASSADEASSGGCSRIRISSAYVPTTASGENAAAIKDLKQHSEIPTVSSALSLTSMVSSSNGEDVSDIKPVVYPESNGSCADSNDYGIAFSASATAATTADSATVAVATTQGYNGTNNGSSSSSLTEVTSAQQRQPSLSEYINRKSSVHATSDSSKPSASASIGLYDIPEDIVPINDSWTGINFHELHKKASELRKNYDEYQPTPTPHHSPNEGAVSEKELLDMLGTNPDALVTPDNIGNFNTLLEQLLGNSGRIQEALQAPGFGINSQSVSFGSTQSLFQLQNQPQQQQQQQQQFGFGQQSSLDMRASTASSSVNVDLNLGLVGSIGSIGLNVADSMTSSPSAASLVNAQCISANGTPETMEALQFSGGNITSALQPAAATTSVNRNPGSSIFAGIQTISIDDIDKLFATANSSGGGVALASQSINTTAPTYGSNGSNMPLAFSPYSAAISGSSQTDIDGGAKTAGTLKQTWINQKPGHTPTPRSTRFSRFHPYLKTMARIAHRDSPTLLNRVPSTADPNVAAAAVNVIAGKMEEDQKTAALSEQKQALSEFNSDIFASLSGTQQASKAAIEVAAAVCTSESAMSNVAMLSDSEPFELRNAISTDFANDGTAFNELDRRAERDVSGGEGGGEDVRRYVCSYAGCTKLFKRHEHLKRHFRTHTGERPYKCPMIDCGKVFARMDNLNQHIRTHVNRKTTNRRVCSSSGTTGAGSGAGNGGITSESKAAASVQDQQMQSDPEPRPQQEQEQIEGSAAGGQRMIQQNAFSFGDNGEFPAFGDISIFGNVGMPAFVSGSNGTLVSGLTASSADSTAAVASTTSTIAGLRTVQQDSVGAAAETVSGYSDIVSVAKDFGSTGGAQNGNDTADMRIPPEDLAMFNPSLMVQSNINNTINNNNCGDGGLSQLKQQQQPLQSPPIENNAVSMLRKMSKNNKPRGIVSTSNIGINGGDSSNAADSMYRFRSNQQQIMSAFMSSAMPSAFGSTIEQGGGNSNNGVGFADLQSINNSSDDGAMGISNFPRSLSGGSNVSSINPVWLASFLAQNQNQQQSAAQVSTSGPSSYFNPYSGNSLVRMQPVKHSIGRQPSLKRHLDDDEDDSDVVMHSSSKDRSRQSMNVSEDEHSDSKPTTTKSTNNAHKFVRPNIAPKPSISPV
ncbi:hypothetical protein IWW48_003557 [Coemansia sp. RSA 1200]|nr:hypothetical protein IWW48_003557 [Coemansia sp. RSA 1200]